MDERQRNAEHMPDYDTCTSCAQRKLVISEKETPLRHLVTSAVLPACLHRCHPKPVGSAYAFHFFPHELHTQYASEYVRFPFVQKPHRTPGGPASSQPQHPFDAEKSFPSVCVDVMIWQFSLPHFGHLISLFLLSVSLLNGTWTVPRMSCLKDICR